MKKILAFVLACTMLLALCACGGKEPKVETTPEPKIEVVENQEITLSLYTWNDDKTEKNTEPVERVGVYTGEVLDGIPHGHGKFETQNSLGDTWYYEGDFENGTFNGEGGCYWPENGYQEVGHYENGCFEPTRTEFYTNAIRVLSSSMFINTIELDETTVQFIEENEDIFPAMTDDAKAKANDLIDTDIEYKHLTKSIGSHLENLFVSNSHHVTQTRELNYWGRPLTFMIIADGNYSNFQFAIYDGSIEIYDQDTVDVVSLPIDTASYDNLGGGTTNVVVTIVSVINKV